MRSRLPPGYSSLLVCDTQRAHEWRDGLRLEGFDVTLVETAADNTDGSWEVGVKSERAGEARALVTDVVEGRRRLRRPPFLSPSVKLALLALSILALPVLCTRSIETRPAFSLQVVDETGAPRRGAQVTFISGDGWGPRADRFERLTLDREGTVRVDRVRKRIGEPIVCLGEGRRRDAWVCVREHGRVTVASAVGAYGQSPDVRIVLPPLAPGATDDPEGVCDDLEAVRKLARR